MLSISVINDGKVIRLFTNEPAKVGTHGYTLRSDCSTVRLQINLDQVNGGIWADVWQVTNAIRANANWPEASVIASMAVGFNFYDIGTSKIRPMDGVVRYNLETSDLED